MIEVNSQEEFDSVFSEKISDKVVILKKDSYKVTKGIELGDNVVIEGNGSNFIVEGEIGEEVISAKGTEDSRIKEVFITDLNIYSNVNKEPVDSKGISISNVEGVTLKSITVKRFGKEGISLESVEDARVETCSVQLCKKGISLFGGKSTHVSNNVFTENEEESKFSNLEDSHVIGNIFSLAENSAGMKVTDSKQSTISSNVYNELKKGIEISNLSESVILGNSFSEISSEAIHLSTGNKNNSITGNNVEKCGAGILLDGVEASVINSNVVKDSKGNGIELKARSKNNLLYSNILENNGGSDFVNSGTDNQTSTTYNHFLGKAEE